MDWWMDRQKRDGWIDRYMDRWINGWMDIREWMDEWTDGWTYGRMDVPIDELIDLVIDWLTDRLLVWLTDWLDWLQFSLRSKYRSSNLSLGGRKESYGGCGAAGGQGDIGDEDARTSTASAHYTAITSSSISQTRQLGVALPHQRHLPPLYSPSSATYQPPSSITLQTYPSVEPVNADQSAASYQKGASYWSLATIIAYWYSTISSCFFYRHHKLHHNVLAIDDNYIIDVVI